MKYLIATILLTLFALPVYAVRFDWSLGQPTQMINASTTGAYGNRVDWSLGQPTVMASSSEAGGEPPVVVPSTRSRLIIISELNLKQPYA